MWLQTINQLFHILYNKPILEYTNFINGQYVFRLKKTIKFLAIANLTNIQPKNKTKPANIKLWHLHMGHLSYRSLTTLKNLSSGMNFKETTLSKLCGDCQKENRMFQPLKSFISQTIEFLGRLQSDFERFFPWTRQNYWYYISFLEESIDLIDIEPLKFKNNALAAFKNYRALRKKQSGCQLNIFYTDRKTLYIRQFDDYLKENGIAYEVTVPSSFQ